MREKKNRNVYIIKVNILKIRIIFISTIIREREWKKLSQVCK
jgi:hypothetical protein